MSIDTAVLEETIRRVLAKLPEASSGNDGVFVDMDSAIAAATKASREYLSRSLADRRRYVQAIRDCMLRPENLDYMSTQAVAETGMGDVSHKYLKNKIAAEGTPGVEDLVTEAWSGDNGLTTVEYSPFGVVGAITPTTNPTETITCNTIGMLAAGNSVVFSPHPRAKNLSLWQIRKINQAYFAFYGTYADSPQSSNPVGPKIEKVWELTRDVGLFLRIMRDVRDVEGLDEAIADLGG